MCVCALSLQQQHLHEHATHTQTNFSYLASADCLQSLCSVQINEHLRTRSSTLSECGVDASVDTWLGNVATIFLCLFRLCCKSEGSSCIVFPRINNVNQWFPGSSCKTRTRIMLCMINVLQYDCLIYSYTTNQQFLNFALSSSISIYICAKSPISTSKRLTELRQRSL